MNIMHKRKVERVEELVGSAGCLCGFNSRVRNREAIVCKRVATWILSKDLTPTQIADATGNSSRTIRKRVETMKQYPKGLSIDEPMNWDELDQLHERFSRIEIRRPKKSCQT